MIMFIICTRTLYMNIGLGENIWVLDKFNACEAVGCHTSCHFLVHNFLTGRRLA
jgi:hypothetical protein